MAGTSFDIAVIGGGIAGLTAAHHAALAGVSVAHFIADGMPGGLVMNVGALDGWPASGTVGGAEVVVAGGGDAALSEAIHLAEFARTVTIVTRGEMFRARRSYVSRVAGDERFRLRWASQIVEVLGDKGVEGVRVRDNEAGNEEVVACSGLFVFVGLAPNAGLLSAGVARDAHGFVVTDANFETASPGVFAVGAVRSGYGGRLTQAVAEATTAAERAAARCED